MDLFSYPLLRRYIESDIRYIKLKLILINYDYYNNKGQYIKTCVDIWANILLLIYGARDGFIIQGMDLFDLATIVLELLQFSEQHHLSYRLKILPLYGDAVYVTTYYNYYCRKLYVKYYLLDNIIDPIERSIIIKELTSSTTSESTNSDPYYVNLTIESNSFPGFKIPLLVNNIETIEQSYLTSEYYFKVSRVLLMDPSLSTRMETAYSDPKDLEFVNKSRFDYSNLLLDTTFDRTYEFEFIEKTLQKLEEDGV